MMNAVDPKCKPWATAKEELRILSDENISPRRSDHSLCLNHGFHQQATYSFNDPIRCLAFRSNSVREEFLINHGTGPGNVLHLRMFSKGRETSTDGGTNSSYKEAESYTNRFPISCPLLQHIVWVPKHRLFVGISSDKNLRVFSDTLHRCQVISAPTVCAMPVISMVYLPETDEVVTGGIGVIQPWKIRISTGLKSTPVEGDDVIKPKRKSSVDLNGMPQASDNTSYGHGLQMLQAVAPYSCDIHRDDWVHHMRVYHGREVGDKRPLLVAVCHDTVIAINYLNKKQIWVVRLNNPGITISQPGKLKKKEKKSLSSFEHRMEGSHYSKGYVVHGHVSLTRCEFFPRFGYFISGGAEGSIRIMHMVNFGLVTILRGHRGSITGLVAHRHHPLLISASTDGSIRMWCLETFKLTQRLDTGQKIENLCLSNDSNIIYYYSKQKISLYRLTNIYSLFSVLHSSATKLMRVEGNPKLGIPGKVLAALEDGSVAVLSPITGLLLTMIYPMTSFQVLTDIAYDVFQNLAYIKLQSGSVMQCECSTNPCCPIKIYSPYIQYDDDVSSLTSVCIKINQHSSINAVFAGLRNGQISLLHPNTLHMPTLQAHNGFVRFIESIARDDSVEMQEEPWCTDVIVSVGLSSVRTWIVEIQASKRNNHIEWLLHLQPQYKMQLPLLMLKPVLLTVLKDRLCISTNENQILVLSLSQSPSGETNATAKQKNEVGSFTDDQTLLKLHHSDDDHVTRITALQSSIKLNCFTSSSEDGYVKIWDEENRLLREMCFTPHHVTALCFVNGRDLLVALGGKICLVDCTTYLTRNLVQERDLLQVQFHDDQVEPAIPYDDNIKAVFKIDDLPVAPLEALQRVLMSDIETDNVTRQLIIDGMRKPRRRMEGAGLVKPKLHQIKKMLAFRKAKEKDGLEMKEKEKEKKIACEKSVSKDEKSENIQSSGEKICVGATVIDVEVTDREACLNALVDHKGDEIIETHTEFGTEPIQLLDEVENICGETCLVEDKKIPIAPDGYIPNSVIRQIVRPPTPEFTTMDEWKLKALPPCTPPPEEESVSSECYDGSESTSIHLNLDFSISFSDVSSLDDPSAASSSEEEFLGGGNLPSLARKGGGKDAATKKIMFFEEIQQRTEVFEDERLPAVQFRENKDFRGKSKTTGVPTRTSRSDLSANVRSSEVQQIVSANLNSRSAANKQIAMKEKLMQQRSAAVEKAKLTVVKIHPLLESITSAPWFRKKLDVISPDNVVHGLLEVGDTVRVFAHEKSCENLLSIVQEFDIKEGGGKEYLSPECLTKIQTFISKFLRPSYEKDNEIANHVNRIPLVHNALDAVISGVPSNSVIQRELYRLIADEDEGVREKVKLILEVKFGINSWDKLKEELSVLAGGEVVQSAEDLFQMNQQVLDNMEERLKKENFQGSVTLAAAPLVADKFGLEIIRDLVSETSFLTLNRHRSSSIFSQKIKSQSSVKGVNSKAKVKSLDKITPRSVQFKDARKQSNKQSAVVDLNNFPMPTYDEPQAPTTKPEIPWRESIPKKSLKRRKMAGLIRMMTPAAPTSVTRRSSIRETRSNFTLESISTAGPPSESGDSIKEKIPCRFILPPIPQKTFNPDIFADQPKKTKQKSAAREHVALPKIAQQKLPKFHQSKTKTDASSAPAMSATRLKSEVSSDDILKEILPEPSGISENASSEVAVESKKLGKYGNVLCLFTQLL
ncbi:uncharacterized protein LOC144742410 [Ciona intestinalis]